jgi:hypothetical protein
MATIHKAFPTELAARHAIEALRAAGVRHQDVKLLIGSRPRDIRRERVGGFAGPIGPEAPVGTFAGGVVQRWRGTGTFAGDPDRRRQGSFADTDRVVIVASERDRDLVRVTGLRGARRLLRRSALADDAVDSAVDELHRGRAVVLADSHAEAQLEDLADAA